VRNTDSNKCAEFMNGVQTSRFHIHDRVVITWGSVTHVNGTFARTVSIVS